MKAIEYKHRGELPKTFLFKDVLYTGEATFIKGYNGYTSSDNDGCMCALINNSCWNAKGEPNVLTDINGMSIVVKYDHGNAIKINKGQIVFN